MVPLWLVRGSNVGMNVPNLGIAALQHNSKIFASTPLGVRNQKGKGGVRQKRKKWSWNVQIIV